MLDGSQAPSTSMRWLSPGGAWSANGGIAGAPPLMCAAAYVCWSWQQDDADVVPLAILHMPAWACLLPLSRLRCRRTSCWFAGCVLQAGCGWRRITGRGTL